jgi:hypothetical protein
VAFTAGLWVAFATEVVLAVPLVLLLTLGLGTEGSRWVTRRLERRRLVHAHAVVEHMAAREADHD